MDISQLLDVIRKLKDDNTDIKECLDFMQMWYRDILMYKNFQRFKPSHFQG